MTTDTDATTADAVALEVQARGFVITDDATYREVAEFLLGIKALRAKIAATFDEHIKRAYDAHRALCAEKRHAEAAAVAAERIAKDLLTEWDAAQARAREQERVALAAALQEQQLADAVAVADADPEQADEILAAPVPLAAVAPAVPKVEGISYRETWSARVDDLDALIRAAILNDHFRAYLLPNMPALHALARSLRARLKIPGVTAVCSKDVAAGRR